MTEHSLLEQELAILIVDTLNLEETQPADIDPEAPLFGDGLGLDSIDALELVLAIAKSYGVQMRADNPDNKQIFRSLRSLSQYIAEQRQQEQPAPLASRAS